MSPTQRTLRALKGLGLVCAIVERWIPRANIRRDLFGIIDIIALDPARGVVGVQSCGNDFSGHDKKIREEKVQQSFEWLSTPGTQLELWAWRKVVAKRGGKQKVWRPRIKVYTMADIIDPLMM